MSTEHSSSSFSPPHQDEPRRRAPEIDAYVDHFLATLCETSRRQILEVLTTPKSNESDSPLEWRSSDIARALRLSPATTSEHLKRLTHAGLLTFRRDGNACYYRIRNYLLVKAFHELVEVLDKDYTPPLPEVIGEDGS